MGGVKYTSHPVSSSPADWVLFATWGVEFTCSNPRQELGLFLLGKTGNGLKDGFGAGEAASAGPWPLRMPFGSAYDPIL